MATRNHLALALGLRPKLLPIILLEFPRTITYCSFIFPKIFLEDTLALRNTSFKTVESNEVNSLVLAANRKQVVRYDCTIRVSERYIRVY